MARQVHNDVLDAGLDEIATSDMLRVCSGASAPADRAAAVTATLADVVLTPGDGNGDFVIADDTSGRKLTVSEQADIDIDADGTALHITLDDGTTLLYVTTCTSQALLDTGTVTVPAWEINLQDPVAP